jgi:hypothetical protein
MENRKNEIRQLLFYKYTIMNWINYVGYVDIIEFDKLLNSIRLDFSKDLKEKYIFFNFLFLHL